MSTTTGREQPFECHVCHSRFTRHENLKRHSDLHTRAKGDPSFACRTCRVTFSRRDLLDRHVKRKHPDQEEGRPVKVARRDTMTSVGQAHKGSDPKNHRARYSSVSPVAEHSPLLPQLWDTGAYMDIGQGSWDSHISFDLPMLDHNEGHFQSSATAMDSLAMPGAGGSAVDTVEHRPTQLSHDTSTLFEDATINSHTETLPEASPQNNARHLGGSTAGGIALSTPSSGYSSDGASSLLGIGEPLDPPYNMNEWYPSESQVARGLETYFSRVSHFVPFIHQPTYDPSRAPLYLTLSILSIAYQYDDDPNSLTEAGSGQQLSHYCYHRARVLSASEEEIEGNLSHNLAMVQALLLLEVCAMMYICGKTSTQGLKMHSRMISIARSAGLLRTASPATATTKDLDSMWREAIKAESHKRTMLAAHQIDALWYQFLSVPRSLSHLEVKHDLPCPEDCWTARTASDWAHRRLVASHTKQTQYTEAVRIFLSRSPEVDSIPDFDSYGAINIAHFLLSSAREVSGWSTMTGQVSLERFEPLKASLVALAPFICRTAGSTMQSTSATGTATWEMAMIELNIWSPAHTFGIVESSLDAVLSQSTYLAMSSEIPFGTDVVAAIQPHLDWFLRFLDTANEGTLEAPWLSLYAYKAFLLAWQLVRAGVPGTMQVVGAADGDADGAVAWLRSVLSKRPQRRLGKMIVECLHLLDKRL